MHVIDARLDGRPFRSFCERLAARAGASRWLLVWPDGDHWCRFGDADPRDGVLIDVVARRLAQLEPGEPVDVELLGPPAARLAATGLHRLATIRIDERSGVVLVLEDPERSVTPDLAWPGWFALALGGALRSEPAVALRRWLGVLPRVADDAGLDEALAGLADALGLTSVVLACPSRRGVRVLTWRGPAGARADGVDEEVRFDAEWADLVADPASLFGPDDPDDRLSAVAGGHQLVLVATGGPDLDAAHDDLALAADLLAHALGNHSVRAASDDAVRQAERTRLATALHEELSQRLAALTIQIDVLTSRPAGQRMADELGGLRAGVVDALEALRSAIYELTPPEPDWVHLDTGLARFVDDHGASRGLDVTFDVEGAPRPIEPDQVSMVFATVQEGLTNIAKHAGTTDATVRLRFAADLIEVAVVDRGVGLAPRPAGGVDRGHQGLGVLRTRARLVGASLDVEGEPGSGTRLVLRVPTLDLADAS